MSILKWSAAAVFPLLLATACGEVPNQGDDDDDDAGTGMDGGGTGPDGAVVGFATIITVIDGTPRPGIPVTFQDENGDVSDRLLSDAQGRATAEVHRHAMATALIQRPGSDTNNQDFLLLTVTDLNPGEEVQVGPRLPPRDYTHQTTLTINTPGDFAGASYFDYRAGSGCGTGGPASNQVIMDLSKSCIDPLSRFAILAVARADDNTALAYSVLNATWSGGSTMTVGMPAWRTDFGLLNVTAINAPPQSTFLSGGIELWQNNISFSLDDTQQPVFPGGTTTMGLTYPKMIGSRFAVTTFLGLGTGAGIDGVSLLFQRFNSLPADLDVVDLSTFLPKISGVVQSGAGPRPKVGWSNDAGDQAGAGADGGLVLVTWNTFDMTGMNSRYQWVATIRPDAPTSFTFPALLGDDAAWLPPSDPSGFDNPQVVYLATDVSDDYASFRAIGLSTMIDNGPPEEVGHALATFAGSF